jgi:hypothetical protein
VNHSYERGAWYLLGCYLSVRSNHSHSQLASLANRSMAGTYLLVTRPSNLKQSNRLPFTDNAALLAAHSSRSRDTSIREEPRHRRKPLKPDTSRRRHSTHVGRSPRPTNYVSTESPSYSRTLQPYYTHESSESFTHSHNTTRGYIDATGDERTGHDLDSIGNQYPQPAVENDGTTSSDFQPPEDNDEDVKSQTDSSERSSVSDQSLALLSPEELQLRLHQLRKKLDSIDDKALIDQVEHHMKDKDDRLSRAAMSLMKIRDANTDTKSDEHFNNSVQRLRHIIKYWSMSQKLGKSSETDTSRRSANSWWPRTPTNSSNYNVQKLKIVMPYYDYTKSPRGFSNLVQACIWDFLARKLFGFHNWDGNGKLGRLKRAYADFKDNLQHGMIRHL